MQEIAALFDMDHTITWENSGLSSVRFARKHGLIPLGHLIKTLFKITLYRFSLLNIEAWYEKSMEILSGVTLDEMERFSELWFETMIRKTIYKEAVSLINDHLSRGHRLVIITNSPSFFVHPMAQALNIRDILCTKVEMQDGRLTGKLVKPLCYGEGKVYYARTWARENCIELEQSYFYTDSFFDIDLMQVVGHPVATNPDMKLRKAALENNWPILMFRRTAAF
ncbi:MAG: HAD family hydrolase [Desulfomonilia bacterium]